MCMECYVFCAIFWAETAPKTLSRPTSYGINLPVYNTPDFGEINGILCIDPIVFIDCSHSQILADLPFKDGKDFILS